MTMAEGLGVTPVYNLDGGSKDDGMFGGGGMWIFFLFFLLAWGGNGFGGLGGGNAATNQINNDFLYSNLSSQLRDSQLQNNTILNSIQQGLCSTAYENLQNINGVQNTLLQGFAGINSSIAECCCGTQKELLINRYEAEKNTAAIVNAIHADGEATRGLMNANTIQDLRDRLTASELANSQCAQNAYIVNAIRPYPVPAYPTCSPYTPYNGCSLC